MVDVLQHDHTGLNTHAKKRQETDTARHAEVRAGDEQGKDAPYRGDGDVTKHEQRPLERTKHRVKDQKNEQYGKRDYNHEPSFSAFLAFVFAFPVDVISPRKLYVLIDSL